MSSDRPDGKHKVKSDALTRPVVRADEHAIYVLCVYVYTHVRLYNVRDPQKLSAISSLYSILLEFFSFQNLYYKLQ